MTTKRSVVKPLCIAAIGGLVCWGVYRAGASAALPPPPPPAPAIVGLVNMETLMSGLQEVKARRVDLLAVREKRQKEIIGYKDRLEKLSKDLELLKEGKERRDKAAEGKLLQAEGQTKQDIYKQLDALDDGELTASVYKKAVAAITKVAAKDGFSLVLLDDRPLPLPAAGSGQDMINIIINKKILYAAENIDITERIVTEMNNEYGAPAPRGEKQ